MGAWNAILPLVFLLIGQGNPGFVQMAEHSAPLSYEMDYADHLSIPKDSLFSLKKQFSSVFEFQGREVLGIANWNRNSIRFFELRSETPFQELHFDPYTFGRIRTFYLINEDSLLLFSRYSQKDRLILTDLQGESVQDISYDQWVNWNAPEKAEIENVECLAYQPVQYSEGKVFFGLLPYDKLNSHPEHKREYAAHIDLQRSTFFRYPLYHPESYYHSDYIYSYDLAQTEVVGNKMILSYNGVPDFYVYDIESGQSQKYRTESKYFELKDPPINTESRNPAEVKMEQGSYGRIVYDPYRKLYYRIIHPPTPLVDEETGLFRTYAERKVSILIMNENFETVGESQIFEGFRQNSMGVTEEGLLILDLKATEQSNDQIVFAVINLNTHKSLDISPK